MASEGEGLVHKLQELIETARSILDRANEAEQYGPALAAVRELTRIFELIAKLTGQLDESARVNVAVVQQQQRDAEQALMLERLTVPERLELRRLVAKAQGEDGGGPKVGSEVSARPLGQSVPATNGFTGDVGGESQSLT